MSLVHNEQTKVPATYLNGLAIAVIVVGGLAPNVATSTSAGTVPSPVALSAVVLPR